METHDNTEDQPWWMNDPDEVTMRILEDPAYFEARHPEQYAERAKKIDLVAMYEPSSFRGRIIQFLGMLPKMIREARKMPKSAKIAELARIEKAIARIIIPPVPIHDDVWDLIQSKEIELREYHLQILGLIREIEDSNNIGQLSVLDFAAMCCCLQMVNYIGDKEKSIRKISVRSFIRTDIMPKYETQVVYTNFNENNIADKCSKFKRDEAFRGKKETSFCNAILLMKHDKVFYYAPAIGQAETILAKINADRK